MIEDLKQLCEGNRTMRPAALDIQTKCERTHATDPYLRLGPFLNEHLNRKGNYVGQVHQLLSHNEVESVIHKSKERQKYFR